MPSIQRLGAVLDELLDIDVHQLSNAEVHDSVIALQRVDSRVLAASSTFVREWDVRKVWEDDGSRSPAARLARDADVRGRPAHRRRRTADECDVDHDLPHVQGGITSQENGRLRCVTHDRNHTKRNQRPRRRGGSPSSDEDVPDDPAS